MVFPSAINIWCVEIDTVWNEVGPEALLGLLSGHDIANLPQAKPTNRYREQIVTRALLQSVFASQYSRKPGEFEIVRPVGQPPSLVNPKIEPPIRFSISHSAKWVACAFSNVELLGIDLENKLRKVNHNNVGLAVFSKSEMDELSRLSGTEAKELFFKYWTLKEALIKCFGASGPLPLPEISFSIKDERIHCVGPSQWQDRFAGLSFALLSPIQDHQMAVAYKVESPEKTKFEFRMEHPF